MVVRKKRKKTKGNVAREGEETRGWERGGRKIPHGFWANGGNWCHIFTKACVIQRRGGSRGKGEECGNEKGKKKKKKKGN